MNHPNPPCPKTVPAGFFRFTRWSSDPLEEFVAWRTHFDALGVRTVLVHSATFVALFREGVEAVWADPRSRRNSPEK